MMEFNAQTMVFLSAPYGSFNLKRKTTPPGAVTIKSDFGQIHSERQQRRDTPLVFMISTRAQRKTLKVI